jgi:ATP-dependent Clp protease protease subunit
MVTIKITGMVTAELVTELTKHLIENGDKGLEIYIDSVGGKAVELAILCALIPSLAITINTYNIGTVQSAACFLFLMGTSRSAIANSTFMFHPARLPMQGEYTLSELRVKIAGMEQLEGALESLLYQKTNSAERIVEESRSSDVFYSATTAVDLGIAHKIMTDNLPEEFDVHLKGV